jgi:hypothetical protein
MVMLFPKSSVEVVVEELNSCVNSVVGELTAKEFVVTNAWLWGPEP